MISIGRKQILRSAFFILAVLLLWACSKTSPEWQAASAAKDYYDCLAKGHVEGFVQGKAGWDSLPVAYREQVQQAAALYLADVKAKHGGLHQVLISEDHYQDSQETLRDTVLQHTYAFLILCFSDSTQEEIVVPMVEADERWLMK